MKATVYIDTSIPSYYVDTRPTLGVHIERTRAWWDRERDNYQVFTSTFVLREIEEGDFPGKQQALKLVQDVPLLAPTLEIESVVKEYIENYVMPLSNDRDGFHLAYASHYKMDYLLTWNCAHLANVNKRQHIATVNRRLGLFVPIIVTPLELLLPERRD